MQGSSIQLGVLHTEFAGRACPANVICNMFYHDWLSGVGCLKNPLSVVHSGWKLAIPRALMKLELWRLHFSAHPATAVVLIPHRLLLQSKTFRSMTRRSVIAMVVILITLFPSSPASEEPRQPKLLPNCASQSRCRVM